MLPLALLLSLSLPLPLALLPLTLLLPLALTLVPLRLHFLPLPLLPFAPLARSLPSQLQPPSTSLTRCRSWFPAAGAIPRINALL